MNCMRSLIGTTIAFFFLFPGVLAAQSAQSSGWVPVNGTFDGDVVSIEATGSGIYVATEDSIYLTTNNGDNWESITSTVPTHAYITTLALNGTSLFAGTQGSGIFRSTDNGETWTSMNSWLGQSGLSVNVMAANGKDVYASTAGGIFVSTDDGASWKPGGYVDSSLAYPAEVDCLAFIGNEVIGYYVTYSSNPSGGDYGHVMLSIDHGTNWTPAASLPGLVQSATGFEGVTTVGDDIYVATGGPSIYYSKNLGASWTALDSGLANTEVASVVLVGQTMFAGTLGQGLYRSTDDGTIWAPCDPYFQFHDSPTALAVDSVNNGQPGVLAGTGSGGVFLSTDAGTKLETLNASLTYKDPRFLATSGNRVFCGSAHGLFVSTDNGLSWKLDSLYSYIHDVVTVGDDVYASGNGIFVSTDDGVSWTKIDDCIDVPALAVVGSDIFADRLDTLYRFGNSGSGWTSVRLNLSTNRTMALLSKGSEIFACDVDSAIFMSSDNGSTWIRADSGVTNTELTSMTALGSDLFAGTEYDGIFCSTNDGLDWEISDSTMIGKGIISLASAGQDLFAGSDESGVSPIHSLYLSTDLGNTWAPVDSGLMSGPVGMLAANGKYLFTGSLGAVFNAVWRRPLSQMVPTGIEQDETQVPCNFSLSQNYPNPFNPTTNIGYRIADVGLVTLKVYNVLGELVKTLVNKVEQPGSYKVTFDAAALASGVYFCRIKVHSLKGETITYLKTMKLMLLK